jgi:hypothetical protein
MADPRHYSISILENFSDKSLHEIAIVVAELAIRKQEAFVLQETQLLDVVGIEFLHTPDDVFTWYEAKDDLQPVFDQFPDVVFCLSVSDGEAGGQYRVLFFNGKNIEQYPEIRYPEFHLNDFDYQTSKKEPLPIIQGKLLPTVTRPPHFLEASEVIVVSMGGSNDTELKELIKTNLFGNIITGYAQDA